MSFEPGNIQYVNNHVIYHARSAFEDYDEGPLKTTGHIAAMGPARGAWFHDPDGNTLGLRQG